MEVVETNLIYPSSEIGFTFWDLTDIHYGSRYCDEDLLDKYVERIKNDPYSRWWLGGDPCDFIVPQDSKRFDPKGVAPWIGLEDLDNVPMVQSKRLTERLEPIADKLLGVQQGNHDDAIRRQHSFNVHVALLGKMNDLREKKSLPPVPSLGYSAFHVLRFHRNTIRKKHGAVVSLIVYLHHGYFTGRLKGSRALAMERIFAYYDCDLAMFGHCHDRLAFKTVCMRVEKKSTMLTYRARSRAVVTNGGFLRGLALPGETAPYTEQKGLYPTELGPIPVKYYPEHRTMDIVQ